MENNPVHAVNPELWKLWKEYRTRSRGDDVKYFRQWLKHSQKKPKLDWAHSYRNGVVQQTTLEIDGFHVVVKVEYDEDSSLHDSECYGTYDDSPEDHYAIDRHQGKTPGWCRNDSRKRYYNEPRHSSYEKQRDPWLNVYAPRGVFLSDAVGHTHFETREKITAEFVQRLREVGATTVTVQGRVVRRCRYGGVSTRSKSVDDVTVRGYIRNNRKIVDDWYEDRWTFYYVGATAYMGEVELGQSGVGGVDSVDDDHVNETAWDVANEAAREARKTFNELRGTSDSRCELIAKIYGAAVDGDHEFDAWLGYLYAAIAKGEALDTEGAPLKFDEFLREHGLRKDVKLYLKRGNDDD